MSEFAIDSKSQSIGNAISIQSLPISTDQPTNGQLLQFSSTSKRWEIVDPPPPDVTKVDRSGDTMTGDLFLSIASDMTRQLGCNDLQAGETFRIVMGDPDASISFNKDDGILRFTSEAGPSLRGGDEIIQVDSFVGVLIGSAAVNMEGNKVVNLLDPVINTDASTKAYADANESFLVTVSAARRGVTTLDAHEWSFGASDAATYDTGVIGWVAYKAGVLTDISLSGCTSTSGLGPEVTVALSINDVEQAPAYRVTKGAAAFGTTVSFATPLAFSVGDRINFISKTTTATPQALIASFLARM